MVQFETGVSLTGIKLPPWKYMELEWWCDLIRLYYKEVRVVTTNYAVLQFKCGRTTQLSISEIVGEGIDCTDKDAIVCWQLVILCP